MNENEAAMLAVLKEFARDVESVGKAHIEFDLQWPDLLVTYWKARKILDDMGYTPLEDDSYEKRDEEDSDDE